MLDQKQLITYTNPKSNISEAYRVVRTNIQYASFDKPIKSLVVTSSTPSEGKSTTVSNLAITFAQAGNKVLLIDADLRNPRLHKILDLLNNRGLTNLVAERGDYREYVQHTVIPNLSLISCGVIPPNPSEMLNSKTMRAFIEKVREDFDMVLIDAPPVGTVTDAAIISTYVDGVILVAASGAVEIGAITNARQLLANVNANIVGVVLNRMDKRAAGNQYYYYNYYYDESDDPKNKKKRKSRNKAKSIEI